MEVNLSDDGTTLRINLAYIHVTPKNPEFEKKHKRGAHGHFGDMFKSAFRYKLPDYSKKPLAIGSPAGGSNGARWATRSALPHLQEHHVDAPKKKAEVFGKGGVEVPHTIQDDWTPGFMQGDFKRGHLRIQKSHNPKGYDLIDNSDPKNRKILENFEHLDEALNAGDEIFIGKGHKAPKPYTPPAHVEVGEPPVPPNLQSAGMLVREPDGRIWLREPSNHYGGYEHTFAKGHLDGNEDPQEAAHRELYEETGLKAKIVAFMGDYRGDTTTTRMYLADRTGGEPHTNNETWSMKLVSPEDAHKLLNRARDKEILGDYSVDPNERWLLKHYNGNEDRVATELLANSIYNVMGVPVPKAGSTQFQGRTALTYPAHEGEIRRFKSPSEEVGNNFMVDALLANWDVIGLEDDNILWTKDGPMRLDQGGTLNFRAMGGTKDFGSTPEEVWMMPTRSQTKRGMAFTPIQKRSQASKIAATLSPGVIDDLVDQAPYEDEQMREHVRQALKDRVKWMGQFGRGIIDEKQDRLTADGSEKALLAQMQDDIESKFTPEQLATMTKIPVQPTDNYALLKEQAQEAHHQLKMVLNHGLGVDKDLGAHVHDLSTGKSYAKTVKDIGDHKDEFQVIIDPTNDPSRGIDSVDMVNATILAPHPANIATSIESVLKQADEHGWKVSSHTSRIYSDPRMANSGPGHNNFRDYNMTLEAPNGFQVNLDFNWNEMWLANAREGASSERKARKIEAANPEGLSDEQKAEVAKYDARAQDLYDRAWNRVIDPDREGPLVHESVPMTQNELDQAEADDEGLNDWPSKGEVAQKVLGDAYDTQQLHTAYVADDGTVVYTDERKRLHDEIMEKALKGLKPPKGNKRVLFMAGGPASGKSSALALPENQDMQPDQAAEIDPDAIKAQLPEYQEMVAGGDKYAATGAHEESSDLSKRILAEAMTRGLNVLRDGTGDSNPGKFARQMQEMKDAGYDINVFYVNAPTDVAIDRATSRARRTGRWVPTPEIRKQHKHVSMNFDSDIRPLVENGTIAHLKMFQTEGDPVMFGEGSGGSFSVKDQGLFARFLAKADESDGS